jgi:hypothetical protein
MNYILMKLTTILLLISNLIETINNENEPKPKLNHAIIQKKNIHI